MTCIANATTEHEGFEITDEMIEAGVRAYRGRDSRFMMGEDIVVDIFNSMLESLPKSGADR
jgi:hypothetical protein